MSRGTIHRSVRAEDELWLPAKAKAQAEGTDLSAVIRDALRAYVDGLTLADAWVLGAQAGFDSTREGFNAECAFDHCAPDEYPPVNPYNGEKWTVDSVEA